MGTINSAFGIVSGALNADQQALSTVANNVANASTPGYTEETPDWSQNAPVNIDGIQMGTGVTETGSTSQRDRVLEERLDQQQQLAAASGTRLTALNSIQALFTPDSGASSASAGDIGNDVTSFFDSFSSLEANPTDNALREQVLSSASTLAGDISGAAKSLNQQQASLDQEAAGIAPQVNALTSAIAQLNLQIGSASPHADAGTLEDQRQHDLSQLSQLIGINQITTENNGLTVTTASGQTLVSEGQSFQMSTGTVNGLTDFFVNGSDITSQLASGGGQLGGYLTARDADIPGVLGSLDQFAYNISTTVNALNNAGTDLDGAEGTGTNSAGVNGTGTAPLYIFNQPTQVAGSAAAMSVTMTDPSQIAAAGFGDGTGDNSNAVALASLANQDIAGSAATTSFSVTQNLDSAGGPAAGGMTLYDSLGEPHTLSITYTQTGPSTWSYSASLPATAFASGVSTPVTGVMTFDAGGDLATITPTGGPAETVGTGAGDVSSIPLAFTGLADGASPLNLTWNLLGPAGAPLITQTASASAQTTATQNGSGGQTPIDFYSNFVSTLGAQVEQVQTENAAQNASVTQLQTQNNAISGVNLNNEASALSTLETSYQAASQVFTILNQVMASALNLGVETAVA